MQHLWSHTRRYFERAKDSEPESMAEPLALIGAMYGHEKQIRADGLTAEDKRAYEKRRAGRRGGGRQAGGCAKEQDHPLLGFRVGGGQARGHGARHAANRVRPRDDSGACAQPGKRGIGAIAPSLAPLIERMFRYTWFLATEKRDAMVREGRENELDALVAEARTLHDSLAGVEPDRRFRGTDRSARLVVG